MFSEVSIRLSTEGEGTSHPGLFGEETEGTSCCGSIGYVLSWSCPEEVGGGGKGNITRLSRGVSTLTSPGWVEGVPWPSNHTLFPILG